MTARRVKLRGAQPRRTAKPRETLRMRMARAVPYLLASVLLMVLIGGLIYLPRVLDGYPIQSVKVEGVNDSRRQQEVQVVLESLVSGENFFSVPLQRIYQRAGQIAWVESASVRRDWPDSVVLTIRERVPVAVWNEAELVASSGRPFSAMDRYNIETLPRLSGPAERLMDVMGYYHSMSKVLAQSGLRIRAMAVDARLTARLELDNDMAVVVDRENYARKLRRFVTLYESVLASDSRGVERVDLRYGDGIAVQWRKTTTNESDKRA